MLLRFLKILSGLLHELSDQGAYTRYLSRAGIPPSREAWRSFSEERHAAKYRRAKCC
jgi:hypothetical protein